MKVYIIKYALTKGIFEAEAEPAQFPGFVKVGDTLYNPADWTSSEKDARARANQMRKDKIAALERSIDKLEQLSFTYIRKMRAK